VRVALLVVAALVVAAGATAARPGGGSVTLAITDASVVEGSAGTAAIVFTVQASGSLKSAASVAFATADGTATAPADYAAASGTLAFDRRTKTRTVTVQVVGDTADEADESFQVRLSGATGATIADGTGVGTIVDDDTGGGTGDPVVAAAGDIACDPGHPSFNNGQGTATECRQLATSNLLVGAGDAAVLLLGDNQYEDGTLAKYNASYDPSWGRVKATTRPAPGNHEYNTAGATGYYAYFGAAAGDPARGYYSYDVGTWHLVALNSNCAAIGGCGAGSAEEQWLRADLAAHPAACTLAYWHHPRFSSGEHGSDTLTSALWQALYDAGADVVLVGHDHHYERFAPQTAAGALDQARGLREFVVGTGGRSHYGTPTIRANSEVRNSDTFGVLRLTLRPAGYDWRFVPAVGSFTDAGAASCH
jgi:hypothetical protein